MLRIALYLCGDLTFIENNPFPYRTIQVGTVVGSLKTRFPIDSNDRVGRDDQGVVLYPLQGLLSIFSVVDAVFDAAGRLKMSTNYEWIHYNV